MPSTPIPLVYLKKGMEKAIKKGYPWIFASQVTSSSTLALCQAGELVHVADCRGESLGTGYCNPHSQIVVRMLARECLTEISAAFFVERLTAALRKREKYLTLPYYRLVHSEADNLPGLVVDRFGSIFIVQISTAGMQVLKPFILEALEMLFLPETVVFRNDMPAREKEGMVAEAMVGKGTMPGITQVIEHGVTFLADLGQGQKTGWYYDQRENRRYIASLAEGKSVLDAFCYTGSFGIAAGAAGAASVTFVDSSLPALNLAKEAVALNQVKALCQFLHGKAFEVLASLQGNMYDIVLLDPPPFIRSKKDKAAGVRGYQKLVTLAAPLVAEGGILSLASCSHHMGEGDLIRAVKDGLSKAGKKGEILHVAGAAPDHPIHPLLPQSAYLHAVTVRVVTL